MTDNKTDEAIKKVEEEREIDAETYWVRHLKRNNAIEIENIVNDYPQNNIINIDVGGITNNSIWKKVLEKPSGCSDDILEALKSATLQPEDKWKHHGFSHVIVRYRGVSKRKKIRGLRHTDETKLIGIKCLVRRVSPVRPKTIVSSFQCDAGHITEVIAQHTNIRPPKHCSRDGCESRLFGHLDKRDIEINRQWVYIQDPLEDLTDGGQPEFLKCEVLEDLCGTAVAGDRIVINGQYRSIPIWKNGVLTTSKDVYFDTSSIEFEEREFQDIKITEEDEKTIIALSKSENLFDKMAKSIAPSIIGMGMLKRAIVLMLFAGVPKIVKNGVGDRGHLNILCVSDPGMAKTKLLHFVASVAPRGVFANATTSTRVGLIAPVVRDETTGEYTIQAGAYMIASGGILCLDEISELDSRDLKSLNEPMEDGVAHITKGGLNVTVPANASLLAACNPISGCFVGGGVPLAQQVNIPESTLSRFDLKILLQDISEEGMDRDMIEHITNNHMEEQDTTDLILPDIMRKYIAYARNIKPKLTKGGKKVIDDYYVTTRKGSGSGNNGDTMKVSPRQGTACIRLAEAHARMRLSDKVEQSDSEAATELFDLCLKNVATDPTTGGLDLSRIDHKNKKIGFADSLIKAVREQSVNGKAKETAIVDVMVTKGQDSDKVRRALSDLLREGKLMSPNEGFYTVM